MKKRDRESYKDTADILDEYRNKRQAIRVRLADFASVPPHEYIFELAYCLLTPQSSALHAASAIDALRTARCLEEGRDAAPILGDPRHYIRFHHTKARHLAAAWLQRDEIGAMLAHAGLPDAERAWLVEHVKGLGWKEASHFLRNIGRRELAILDRHILRNLVRHRALRSLPKTLTPKRYLAIEEKFRTFASALGVTIDELDLVFWSRETGEILK